MTSLRRLTLGLAALLLLAWLYERRIRRETVMPRFEPEPTREWHPAGTRVHWTGGTRVRIWEGEAL
jgi:hypothetical protein